MIGFLSGQSPDDSNSNSWPQTLCLPFSCISDYYKFDVNHVLYSNRFNTNISCLFFMLGSVADLIC